MMLESWTTMLRDFGWEGDADAPAFKHMKWIRRQDALVGASCGVGCLISGLLECRGRASTGSRCGTRMWSGPCLSWWVSSAWAWRTATARSKFRPRCKRCRKSGAALYTNVLVLYYAFLMFGARLCGNQIRRALCAGGGHAIDATPARWRGDVGSSPLDGAGPSSPSFLLEELSGAPVVVISTQVLAVASFAALVPAAALRGRAGDARRAGPGLSVDARAVMVRLPARPRRPREDGR